MKKLSLIVAMTAVLSTSTSFAVETDPVAGVQIFKKEISLLVQKDSEVSVDMEAPTNPDENQDSVIPLNMDELMAFSGNTEGVHIGSMLVNTTSSTCSATITTSNSFSLKGQQLGAELAQYSINYMTHPDYQTNQGDIPNNDSPTNFMPTITTFSANLPATQQVNCSNADLFMATSFVSESAPVDAYGDIITIEVRAES